VAADLQHRGVDLERQVDLIGQALAGRLRLLGQHGVQAGRVPGGELGPRRLEPDAPRHDRDGDGAGGDQRDDRQRRMALAVQPRHHGQREQAGHHRQGEEVEPGCERDRGGQPAGQRRADAQAAPGRTGHLDPP
jgi:hypothetical protein